MVSMVLDGGLVELACRAACACAGLRYRPVCTRSLNLPLLDLMGVDGLLAGGSCFGESTDVHHHLALLRCRHARQHALLARTPERHAPGALSHTSMCPRHDMHDADVDQMQQSEAAAT